MTKREILKKYMSVKYCTGTRFDYLDPEERTMIYKAMEAYNTHESKMPSEEEAQREAGKRMRPNYDTNEKHQSFDEGFLECYEWFKSKLTKRKEPMTAKEYYKQSCKKVDVPYDGGNFTLSEMFVFAEAYAEYASKPRESDGKMPIDLCQTILDIDINDSLGVFKAQSAVNKFLAKPTKKP